MRLDDRDFDVLEAEDLERIKKRAKRKKKSFLLRHPSLIPVIVVGILILIIGAVALSSGSINPLLNISANADISELFGGLYGEEAGIILNEEYEVNTRAYLEGGSVFLPYDYVRSSLNDWFYLDEKEGQVLYTTPAGTESYAEGEGIKTIGNEVCLDTNLILKYTDLDYREYLKGDSPYIYLRNEFGSFQGAKADRKSALCMEADKKSDTLAVLNEDEEVRVLESGNEWIKVQNEDGLMGYVNNKHLRDFSDEECEAPGNVEEMVFPSASFNEKVILGWHQVMNRDANEGIGDILAKDTVINVLSPTWFFVSDSEGNFTDNSSAEYVEEAHAAGKKVWPVVDNFNSPDISPDEDIKSLLSDTGKRRDFTERLVSAVKACNADGINLDFESLSPETGEGFAQFLKELSVACHDRGLVLSVDNYVPGIHSLHYNRKVQGKVCDFCIIMGYDEYYAASKEAGPVASIDYVEKGIQDTLRDVDSSKIINGLPLYSRIWETNNGSVLSTQALDMKTAKEAFSSRGVTTSWDDSIGCNYGEYEENGSLWRMWLEDEDSARVKLSVMESYGLSGAAFWKLGFEDETFWEGVSGYASGSLNEGKKEEGDS